MREVGFGGQGYEYNKDLGVEPRGENTGFIFNETDTKILKSVPDISLNTSPVNDLNVKMLLRAQIVAEETLKARQSRSELSNPDVEKLLGDRIKAIRNRRSGSRRETEH